MRNKTLAALLAVIAALAFSAPAMAGHGAVGHGKSGSTIIAEPV